MIKAKGLIYLKLVTKLNSDIRENLEKLEKTLDFYFLKKAPFSLPNNIKELLVGFAPYLIILNIITKVFVFIGLLGLMNPSFPFGPVGHFSPMIRYKTSYVIYALELGIILTLKALSLPGLFRKERQGWVYLFYASLIGLVFGLLSGEVISALFGVLIGWYILFQVKEYYK
jgi:hypothetical protein